MAWHSPHRPVLKFGFFSDRLDEKKMSRPRSGSGLLGLRVPETVMYVGSPPPSPVAFRRAVSPLSRLKFPNGVKQEPIGLPGVGAILWPGTVQLGRSLTRPNSPGSPRD